MQRVLVLADSLAFHGPERPEPLTHPELWPNVMGRELGVAVDWSAGYGWTARSAWWALTKDPVVYSLLVPRADAVVLAVGGMDHLPAAVPTYLREGLAYIRPGAARRVARRAFHGAHPYAVRALGGRLRVLPQRATETYLTRCVEALRIVRPGVPVVGIVPPPYRSPYYGGVTKTHPPAVAAHRRWGERLGVPLVDLDEIVTPYVDRGGLNVDGLHWGWDVHRAVGTAFAAALAGV